jgi:energy-coupling factor transporter ATP-binding protein EcfA2
MTDFPGLEKRETRATRPAPLQKCLAIPAVAVTLPPMNILEQVKFTELWGEKDISISMREDVNFLIGRNGSGKTTVINAIAAALTADFQTLDRIPFKSLELRLRDVKASQHRSFIDIQKKPTKETPLVSISYRIRSGKEDKTYSLEDIEEGPLFRDYMARPFRYRQHRVIGGLLEQLKTLVNVSWLSIHRTPSRPVREERSFESSVDQKLDQLGSELVKFFSALTSKGEAETSKFQQLVFLSLLERMSEWEAIESVKKLNLDEEQAALTQIFGRFKLRQQQFEQEIKQQFELVRAAIERQEKGEKGLPFAELSAVVGMWPIHKVVQEWNNLIARQNEIFEPRDSFLRLLNEQLRNKRLEINDKNELQPVLSSNKRMPLRELSSGEKQLVIILGEALLQEKAPWIYIADEPELSLHVSWQEKLTSNLRQVNPNAQILFATHSPDIVSSYRDRVIDMEQFVA